MNYTRFFFSNFFGFASCMCLNAQEFTSASIDSLSQYIYSQQYSNTDLSSYGAIKKSRSEDIFLEQHYFKIEPYFNHIATIGMLKSNQPDKCGFALRWMNWYINHLDNNGQILNYYYKPGGTDETTCPLGATGVYCNNIDAEDSDPALFWIVAKQYYETTNDGSFFYTFYKNYP